MRQAGLFSGLVLAAATIACAPAPAGAQDTAGLSRTVVRSPTIRGLPSIEIDLEQTGTQRFALVIGNSEYDTADDLPNAGHDAVLVADMLRNAGYTVAYHSNLTKRGFEGALRQTLHDLEYGAEFAFYYAGHGVQIGDGNFLIPTDMVGGAMPDVRMQTVSLSSIMAVMSARVRSIVVVLDSCRNNPFPTLQAQVNLESTPRQLQTGFTAPETPINSLVVFSTSPGAVALDGEGKNSPFTRAFVDVAVANPGRPIDQLMQEIRRRVYIATGKLQVPWSTSSLVEPLALDFAPAAVGLLPSIQGEGAPIRLERRFDRKIALGGQMPDAAPGVDAFALVDLPRAGRLELRGETGLEGIRPDAQLPTARLKDLVYSTQIGGAGADDTVRRAQLSDRFTLQVGPMMQSIDVALQVDPCDDAAGDHLDPDGVGIARYPNEIELDAALAACEAAVARDPEVGRFHYQLGRVLLALRRMDAARATFQRAADLGHARAWHGLGTVAMAEGQATGGSTRAPAPDAAIDLLLQGVQRGDPYAYHTLGLQLLTFPRTEADRRQGFELMSRALELGHTFSMNALGLYFLEDDTDHYDPARGLSYLRESAARSDIYGFANLGYVAVTGAGGANIDFAEAERLFRKAADQGHPTAATSLGRMYASGQIGGRRDDLRAIEWYDRGLERGDAWGGANAAWILANRLPAGFTPFDAAVRAAKAATLRNSEAGAEARQVLAGLGQRALDGGAQQLMRDLGVDVGVDGAFGPASRDALDTLGVRKNHKFAGAPEERLLELAKLYWENTKFRVDLY